MENREINVISECYVQNRDWKNLQIENEEHIVCFTRESGSWKIFLTNLKEIYTTTLTDETMFNKCQSENRLLTLEAFDWKKLVLEMLNDIPQYVHKAVRDIAERRIELRIDIPEIDVKLKFSLDFVEGTSQQFCEIVTIPLCVTSIELVRRYRALLDLVKRKDEEIAEYKAEGAQLLRQYIATKPFNEELFHDNDAESAAMVENFQSVIQLYNEINSLRVKLQSKIPSNDRSATDLKTDENALPDLSTNEPAQVLEEDKLNNDEQVHSKIEEGKVDFSSSKTSIRKINNISRTIHKVKKNKKTLNDFIN
ncbi:hypothetical protein PUN28_014199 [Cardiocondyla obscurior]|uniref:Non-homologous end-joining factor 1 n=1 Tax=Cardiocondyla obscurior TaxID=286306 RepID=A0AAW2F494_9HYME